MPHPFQVEKHPWCSLWGERGRLITKQLERWAECSAINSCTVADWCGGGGGACTHTCTHANMPAGSSRSIWTRQWGGGITVKWWLLDINKRRGSLKVGLCSLWPQILISSIHTHTCMNRDLFVTVALLYAHAYTHSRTYMHTQARAY